MAEKTEKKQNWSEEERLALAAKLDAELDEYINNLEKKSYTEGWAEDRSMGKGNGEASLLYEKATGAWR